MSAGLKWSRNQLRPSHSRRSFRPLLCAISGNDCTNDLSADWVGCDFFCGQGISGARGRSSSLAAESRRFAVRLIGRCQMCQFDRYKGVNRGKALECMTWIGSAVLLTISDGVPQSIGLIEQAPAQESRGLTFLQISDSHTGVNAKSPYPNACVAARRCGQRHRPDQVRRSPRPGRAGVPLEKSFYSNESKTFTLAASGTYQHFCYIHQHGGSGGDGQHRECDP